MVGVVPWVGMACLGKAKAGPRGLDMMFLISESNELESVSSELAPPITLEVEPVLIDFLALDT